MGRFTAEHLFQAGGLGMILSAVLADTYLTIAGGASGDHGSGDELRLLLVGNFAPMGIAFVTWGFGRRHGRMFLEGRRGVALLLAFVLMLFDGVIHLFAFNAHVLVPLHAAFFLGVGFVQIVGAFTLPRASGRALLGWSLLTVLLLGFYALSRVSSLLGGLEEVEGLGLLSKAVEAVLLGSILYRRRSITPASPGEAPREPAGARGAARSPR